MKEATVKTYGYDELAGPARERARQFVIEGNAYYLPDLISETFEDKLEWLGLGGLKTSWSLSHCQGDGVAFEGKINLAEITPEPGHARAIRKALGTIPVDEIDVTVMDINYHYSHWNSFRVSADGGDHKTAALEEALLEWLQDVSRELERLGYAEIEGQESDEMVSETCEANGWVFSASGEPVHHLIEREVVS